MYYADTENGTTRVAIAALVPTKDDQRVAEILLGRDESTRYTLLGKRVVVVQDITTDIVEYLCIQLEENGLEYRLDVDVEYLYYEDHIANYY